MSSLIGEMAEEEVFLGAFVDKADALVYFFSRCFFRLDGDGGWVHEDLVSEVLDSWS